MHYCKCCYIVNEAKYITLNTNVKQLCCRALLERQLYSKSSKIHHLKCNYTIKDKTLLLSIQLYSKMMRGLLPLNVVIGNEAKCVGLDENMKQMS